MVLITEYVCCTSSSFVYIVVARLAVFLEKCQYWFH
jgi:hypothetical protein